MAVLIGMIVGGVLLVWLLSWLLEWAIFKRVLDEPESGIIASVVMAAFLAIILYGFGNANGGSWNPTFEAMFGYAIAAVLVLPLRLRAHRKRVESTSDSEDLADIFR